jgi:hypothetical protein
VKENEMGKACSMNEHKRNAYRILVGKPERKKPWKVEDVGEWTLLK